MANQNRIDFTIGLKTDNASFKSVQDKLSDVGIAVERAATKEGGMTEELKRAKNAANELQEILNKSWNSRLGTYDMSTMTKGLQSSGRTLQQYKQDLEHAGATGSAAWNQMSASLIKSNAQIQTGNKLLNSMFSTMKNTITWGVSSSIFNEMTSELSHAVAFAEKLDTSLNNIRIVTGKTADDMKSVAQWANTAAKNLSASTTDLTNAALIYYQQGDSEKEAQRKAEITTKVANVTGQDTATAADQMTAIWNGFQATESEMESYGDKMAKVAATTASSFQELATGMQKVAAASSTAGVNFDQLNAQMSTIVAVTREAPESVGTALKTIYARMGDLKTDGSSTDESGFTTKLGTVTQDMSKMGINILDETGQMRELGDVIEEVGAKWQGWTRNQQEAAAVSLAGKRQYTQLIALFDNWDKYQSTLATSQSADGELEKQQAIFDDSLKATKERLEAAKESIYTDLFDTDAIKPLIEGLTDAADGIDRIIKSLGGGTTALAAFGAMASKVFTKQINREVASFMNERATKKSNQDRVQVLQSQFNTATASTDKAEQEFSKTLQSGDTVQTQRAAKELSEAKGEAEYRDIIAKKYEEIYRYSDALTEEQQQTLKEDVEKVALLEKERAILKEQLELQSQIAKTQYQDDKLTSENFNAGNNWGENIVEERQDKVDAANKAVQTVDSINVSTTDDLFAAEIADADVLGEKLKEINQTLSTTDANKMHISLDAVSNGLRDIQANLLQMNAEWEMDLHSIQDVENADKRVTEQIEEMVSRSAYLDEIEKEELTRLKTKQKDLRDVLQIYREINKAQQTGQNVVKNSKEHQNAKQDLKNAQDYQKTQQDLHATDEDSKQGKGNLDNMLKGVEKIDTVQTKISNLTNGISMLTSAFSIGSSVVSIFTDDTMNGGEKFVAFATSVLPMLGMLIPSYLGWKESVEKLALARRKNAIAEGEETIAAGVSAGATAASGAAAQTASVGFWEMAAAELAAVGPIVAIVAAVGLLTYGIYKLVTAETQDQKEARLAREEHKKTTETLQSLTSAVNEASSAYDNLKSSIENISSLENSFEGLTKGTVEWQEAVSKLNGQVLELITLYPELASAVTTDEDGVMHIDAQALQDVQQKKLEDMQTKQRAQIMANINNDVASKNEEYTDKKEKYNKKYSFQGSYDSISTNEYNSKSVSEKASYTQGSDGRYYRQAESAFDIAEAAAKDDLGAIDEDWLVKHLGGNRSNVVEELGGEGTLQDAIAAINDLIQSQNDLKDAYASAANDSSFNAATISAYQNDATYQNSDTQDALLALGKTYFQDQGKTKEKWTNKLSDKELTDEEKQYLAAYYGVDAKNTDVSISKDGKISINGQEKEESLDVIAEYIAADKNSKKAQEQNDSDQKKLNDFIHSLTQQGIEKDRATTIINDIFSGKGMSGLTDSEKNAVNEINKQQKEFFSDFVSRVYNGQDVPSFFNEDYQNRIETNTKYNRNTKDDDFFGIWYQKLDEATQKFLKDSLSTDNKTNINDAFNLYESNNVTSKDFGNLLVNNSDKANEIISAFSDIQWNSTIDPMTQFSEKLAALGVNVNELQGISNFTNNIYALGNAIESVGGQVKITKDDFLAVWSELGELEAGKSIKADSNQWTKLKEQYGEDVLSQYFSQDVDKQGNAIWTAKSNIGEFQTKYKNDSGLAYGGEEDQRALASKADSAKDIMKDFDPDVIVEKAELLQDAMVQTGKVTQKEYNKSTKAIEKNIQQTDSYKKAVKATGKEAQKTAKNIATVIATSIEEAEQARIELGKKWDKDNYKKLLKNPDEKNEKYIEAKSGTLDMLQKNFGSDELQVKDFLDDKFLKKHADKIDKMMHGDEQAYKDMLAEIAKESADTLANNLNLPKDKIKSFKTQYTDMIDELSKHKLKVGDDLPKQLQEQLTKMKTAMGLGVQDLNQMLAGMQFTGYVKQVHKRVSTEEAAKQAYIDMGMEPDEAAKAAKNSKVSMNDEASQGNKKLLENLYKIDKKKRTPEQKKQIKRLEENNGAYYMVQGLSWENVKSAAPSKLDDDTVPKSPDKKNKNNKLESTIQGNTFNKETYDKDPYRYINEQLQDIEQKLSRIQTIQENLTGEALTSNLREQNELLTKQIEKEEKKRKIAENALKKDKKQIKETQKDLKNLGVNTSTLKYDNAGNFTNLDDVLQQATTNYNKVVDEYNKTHKKSRTITQRKGESKKAYKNRAKKIKEKLKADKIQMNNTKKALDRLRELAGIYENDEDTYDEQVNIINELKEQQQDNRILTFETHLNVKLDTDKAKQDWDNFLNEIGTTLRVDTDLAFNRNKINTEIQDSSNIVQNTLTQRAKILSVDTKKMLTTGTSEHYGTDLAKLKEQVTTTYDEMKSQVQTWASAVASAWDNVSKSLQTVEDKFKKVTDSLQNVINIYDKQLSIAELLGNEYEQNISKAANYAEQAKRYGDKAIAEAQYRDEILKPLQEDIQNRLTAVQIVQGEASIPTEYVEQYRTKHNLPLNAKAAAFENITKEYLTENGYDDLLQLDADGLQIINDHLQESLNAVNDDLAQTYQNEADALYEQAAKTIQSTQAKIATDIENAITTSSHQTLEDMKKAFDWLQDESGRYLDEVNTKYQLESAELYMQQIIDDTQAIQAKERLTALMREQLGILQDQSQLSQYEVDRAKKLFDIEVKRLALQNAQNNKSKLKLRRDASGNYSYQYVADPDDINKKKQDLLDAENRLYNFDKERNTTVTNQTLTDLGNFQAELNALSKRRFYDDENGTAEENRERALQTIYDHFGFDFQSGYNDLTEARANVIADYEKETGKTWTMLSQDEQNKVLKNAGLNTDILSWFEQKDENGNYKFLDNNGFNIDLFKNNTDLKDLPSNLSMMQSAQDKAAQAVTDMIDPVNNIAEDMQSMLGDTLPDLQQEVIAALNQAYDETSEFYGWYYEFGNAVLKQLYQDKINTAAGGILQEDGSLKGVTKNSANQTVVRTTNMETGAYSELNKTTNITTNYDAAGNKLGDNAKENGTINKGDTPVFTTDNKTPVIFGISKDKKKKDICVVLDRRNELASGDTITLTGESKVYKDKNNKKHTLYKFTNSLLDNYYKDKTTNGLWTDLNSIKGYDTGGYTGEWINGSAHNNGRLAFLHQKEIVLNEKDTANMLKAVGVVRDLEGLLTKLNNSTSSRLQQFMYLKDMQQTMRSLTTTKASEVKQDIIINADFPNVSNSQEIESAFGNLIHTAWQYAGEL